MASITLFWKPISAGQKRGFRKSDMVAFRYAATIVLFGLVVASPAHASMICKRIEQLPSVSDPQIREKIEAFARTNYVSQDFGIHQLDSRYYFLQPKKADCKMSSCYYHLIQLNDDLPTEPFAFNGSGIIWIILSPINMRFESFPDRYSVVAVETSTKALLNISLPLKGQALIIETLSDQDARTLRCSASSALVPVASNAEQASDRGRCPPDGSRIALFSRQAFDQGRELEGREYGKYGEELFEISTSSYLPDNVVEKSIAATINFSKMMRARGHDIGVVDLIIDREKSISDLLLNGQNLSEIRKAQIELQLAVVREMKRIMCR